jgi:hypothetical protein
MARGAAERAVREPLIEKELPPELDLCPRQGVVLRDDDLCRLVPQSDGQDEFERLVVPGMPIVSRGDPRTTRPSSSVSGAWESRWLFASAQPAQ